MSDKKTAPKSGAARVTRAERRQRSKRLIMGAIAIVIVIAMVLAAVAPMLLLHS